MKTYLIYPTCGSDDIVKNVQMDELWSFVDGKKNKQWVWLAMDAETREIIGCYIDRCSKSGL